MNPFINVLVKTYYECLYPFREIRIEGTLTENATKPPMVLMTDQAYSQTEGRG